MITVPEPLLRSYHRIVYNNVSVVDLTFLSSGSGSGNTGGLRRHTAGMAPNHQVISPDGSFATLRVERSIDHLMEIDDESARAIAARDWSAGNNNMGTPPFEPSFASSSSTNGSGGSDNSPAASTGLSLTPPLHGTVMLASMSGVGLNGSSSMVSSASAGGWGEPEGAIVDVKDILRTDKNIIIFSPAGFGKTSLLKYLTVRVTEYAYLSMTGGLPEGKTSVFTPLTKPTTGVSGAPSTPASTSRHVTPPAQSLLTSTMTPVARYAANTSTTSSPSSTSSTSAATGSA
jgi:hypothetical protein